MTKHFIIFDTEFTSWKGCMENGRQEWQKEEVVQIAAVKVDSKTLKVVEEFNVYVRPIINPVLSDYFIALTGITNELIEEQGAPFEQAYGMFKAFAGDDVCYSYSLGQPHGLADGDILTKNIKFLDIDEYDFPKYENIAPYFITKFKEKNLDIGDTNSGRIAKVLGLQNELEQSGLDEHNALYDVYSLLAGIRYFGGI